MTTKQRLQDAAELSARMARAFPGMGILWCADKALELLAIERAQRLHAERDCSEAWYHNGKDGQTPRDRAEKRIDARCTRWRMSVRRACKDAGEPLPPIDDRDQGLFGCPITLEGDPRGAVLKVRLPGEAEAVAV